MTFRLTSERKDLSRFLQAEPNIFLARFLPFSVYRHYLSLIGFYYFSIRRQERKRMSKSLRFFLGRRYSRLRLQLILCKTYFGLFEHYSEKMINAYKSLPQVIAYLEDNVSVSNKDWLDKLNAKKRGGILVTSHFGAVEYLPLFLTAKNYRPAMILRFKTEKLRNILLYKSGLFDSELIDADSENVIYKALEAIKDGRILITLCDEVKNWRPCKTGTMSIFGQPVPRDRTLDILVRRSKAPCCLGLMQRVKNGYNLSIHPIDRKDDDTSLSEAAWSILEQYIYRYPDQWYQWPSFETEYTKYVTLSKSYAN
jgi:Kdo2-lipid IVA lauroyltransferase/acyltransferase